MKRLLHNFILTILALGIQWGREPRLRKWLELESYKDKIIKATDGGDLPRWMLRYLSVALWGVREKWFECADWFKIVSVFYLSISKSPKIELPITSPSNEKSKEEDWNYDGRTWHLYSHMLANAYGWNLEYISQLKVVEALAKIEEIMVDTQLEHEFYYGLSEAAYSYDQRTKTSKYVPLPRPHWMRKRIQPIKKFPIPASMLPVGVVNMNDALPNEYQPKPINHN